ncbi:MAG TPA: hypothetical protein VFZ32_08000 [Micromonosporaceae bacterium]|jgi:hypothetical protein
MGRLSRGLVAGAVGTTALEAAGYLDMAVRGRPASRTPERSVRRLARTAGLDLGRGRRARNRRTALGALLGYATGAGVGAGYAVLKRDRMPGRLAPVTLAGAAMLAANGPMSALGITDPRRWSAQDWAADVLPHLAYGVATATTYRMLSRGA